MGKHAILLLVLAAGAAQPLEVAMNSKLAKVTASPTVATAISFVGGAVVLALFYALGIGGRGNFRQFDQMPWWAYLSGVLGVLIVMSSLIALPMSNTALVIAVLIFGQSAASIAVDHYGWLEVPRVPISMWRVAGVTLIFIGTLMLQNFKGE